MSYQFEDVDDAEVEQYMRQMHSAKPQHLALWDPSPFADREVQLGDVGYIYEGAFRRLFNITVGADDPAQESAVPNPFEPIRFHPLKDAVCYESQDILPYVPYHSRRVELLKEDRTSDNKYVNNRFGVILVVYVNAGHCRSSSRTQ